jgi:hypothetical protein
MNTKCLWPLDPSHRAALGPVHWVTQKGGVDFFTPYSFAGSAAPGIYVQLSCAAGFHFEPPYLDTVGDFVCSSNGLWAHSSGLTLHRCVANKLNCSFPFADLGATSCEPALPLVSELRALYWLDGSLRPVPNLDVVTLTSAHLG